ncbi:MAG: hypothetical protein Q8N63_05655 [Nanoarchaeota archaeon]|nr:hypothetical protein [Nanoarchaeota archaeon]
MNKMEFELITSDNCSKEDIEKIANLGKEYNFDLKEGRKIVRLSGEELQPIFEIAIKFIGTSFAVWLLNKSFDKTWNKIKSYLANLMATNTKAKPTQLILEEKERNIRIPLEFSKETKSILGFDELPKYLKENINLVGDIYYVEKTKKWKTLDEVLEEKMRGLKNENKR